MVVHRVGPSLFVSDRYKLTLYATLSTGIALFIIAAMMTAEQCRMARAGLNVSIADLAAETGLRPSTISAFERGGSSLQRTVDTLRSALEARGAVFFGGGAHVPPGGVGVRLTE